MFTEASEPFRQGNSIMAPEEKEKLAKKKPNISACKDFIHGINQLRADRSFSPRWCASLLLVSEAQTPGWNVSLCVQVERALCASVFPVCYPACQKNSGGDMRGKHSGELHPILFFFSVFISPRDVSSHLKGCVSQHRFSVLTSQLWGAKIATGKKKKETVKIVSVWWLWCPWTPEVQHEKGDFVYVGTYFQTPPRRCSPLTSPSEMNNI